MTLLIPNTNNGGSSKGKSSAKIIPTDNDYVDNVIFWDYDAEVVGIYSISEVLSWDNYSIVNKKLKPHKGLVFTQWNLDLPTLQNYLETYQHPFDIGAMYEAEDGKAHFTINLVQDNDYWGFATNGTATVDWGDGNTETLTDTNVKSHTYALKGIYNVTIETSATTFGWGIGQGRKCIGTAIFPKTMTGPITDLSTAETVGCFAENIIFPKSYNNIGQNYFGTAYYAKIYITPNKLQRMPNQWYNCKVMCGNTWVIWQSNTGTYLYALKRFAIIADSTSTSVYTNYLNYSREVVAVYCDNFVQTSYSPMCYGMQNTVVSLPPKLNFANNIAKYNNCFKLEHIIDFYERVGKWTNLNNAMFSSCGKLKTPLKFDAVTSIAASCFAQCVALPEIDFSNQTVVPTLANINAFTNCNANILIPDALFDEWVASTNWSNLYATNPDRFIRV